VITSVLNYSYFLYCCIQLYIYCIQKVPMRYFINSSNVMKDASLEPFYINRAGSKVKSFPLMLR